MKRIFRNTFLIFLFVSVMATLSEGCSKQEEGQKETPQLSVSEREEKISKSIAARLSLPSCFTLRVKWDTLRNVVASISPEIADIACLDSAKQYRLNSRSVIAFAQAFIRENSSDLQINPDDLIAYPGSSWGDTSDLTTGALFVQCYKEIPVINSRVVCQFRNGVFWYYLSSVLPNITCSTEPKISLQEAVQIIERHEKKRFQKQDSLLPISFVWKKDTISYTDFYDIKDANGTIVPYAKRITRNSLTIFPDTLMGTINPLLAWYIELGYETPDHYLNMNNLFFVNAQTGDILKRSNVYKENEFHLDPQGCTVPPVFFRSNNILRVAHTLGCEDKNKKAAHLSTRRFCISI